MTESQIIEMAIECFDWDRKKVKSWYLKENAALRKARPSELVDRGQGHLVIDFLLRRKQERIANQKRAQDKKGDK